MSAMTALEIRDLKIMLQSFFEKEYLDRVYPIGSIYISATDVQPAALFGGTWEQLKDRFLLGAGGSYPVGGTGGSSTHEHGAGKLYATIGVGSDHGTWYAKGVRGDTNWTASSQLTVTGTPSSATRSGGTPVLGNTDSASVIPPYLAVYMWKRIA